MSSYEEIEIQKVDFGDAGGSSGEHVREPSTDNYQGPHNWRKSLKPVQSPVKEQMPMLGSSVGNPEECGATNHGQDELDRHKERHLPREEKLDEAKIRERLKNTTQLKKDTSTKQRVPMVAKANCPGVTNQGPVGNISPLFTKRRPGVPGNREHGLHESAFTRQVVNKPTSPGVPHRRAGGASGSNVTRIPVPTVTDKKLSPGIIRKTSFNAADNPVHNTEAWRKRVEKVMKARLYLLGQMGPNSFSIGGDSPDHKYKVIIGPQRCNCGRGPHCVHILFVMLRVFQVSESDPCLWSRTLKNFEVETLFRNFHTRRTSRLDKDVTKKKRKSKRKSTESADPEMQAHEETTSNADTESTRNSDSEDEAEELVKEEEDTCPICLLEMVEGESLMECANGCQNKLHHHCISIWFEECRRNNESLICPLCRTAWKQDTARDSQSEAMVGNASSSRGEATGASGVEDQLPVPPNTRASSPQPHHIPEAEGDTLLPYAEPIPSEHTETAQPWLPLLGEEVTSCLFSKNWVAREVALKQVGRVAQGALLLGMGAGRARVVLSPTRQAATHRMLECCCSVLAFMCADPVYKVFVAGLRTLRTVLSYTPCRDETQQSRLQSYMKPVVDTILWKCADSNKRTSQLSISALQELVKGSEGELGVGREIVNPGSFDLGGVGYLLRCITQDYDAQTVQWQWLLGRFYMLDVLIEDNTSDFIILPFKQSELGSPRSPREPHRHYDRVFSILRFSVSAMTFSHQKVSKMARRVFYMIAKLQVHFHEVYKEILELLDCTDMNMQVHMRRKLLKVMEENQQLMHRKNHQDDGEEDEEEEEAGGSIPPFTTPIISAASTPRCNSPVVVPPASPQIAVNTAALVPEVPPNSPNYKRVRNQSCQSQSSMASAATTGESESVSSGMASNAEITVEDASGEVLATPQKNSSLDDSLQCPVALSTSTPHSGIVSPSAGMLTPHGTPQRDTDQQQQCQGGQATPNHNPCTDSCRLHKHSSMVVEVSDACIATSPTLCIRSRSMSSGAILDSADVTSDTNAHPMPRTLSQQDCASQTDSLATRPSQLFCFPLEPSYGEDKEVQTPDTLSEIGDDLDIPIPGPDELEEEGAGQARTNNATFNTTGGAFLTEDLSDLTLSPSAPEDKVSFKTEVASSPQQSSAGSSTENCHCKEEVEKEEAEALAEALAKSSLQQDALPHVPGLCRVESTETLTIHIHEESEDNQPHEYQEGVHWMRGPMLGTGAFSTCYQARDIKTGTIMAVKQISFCRNSLSEQEKVVEAVKEEIQMMAKLNHPNVVRILGATQQGCHFFMFVEWMPGGSVAFLLDRYGPFTEQVMTSYTLQVLRGLAYLHENHMLHRDLKGANLLIDSTGQRVRIGDFGASARLASRSTGAGEFQGQLLGTIAFMAPEVLRGESYGRSCDIWGVGCVIIEMATTKPPWGAHDISNHLALIFKIASSERPPPIPDTLSPPLRDLLLRCLDPNREERPPAKELLKHPVFTMGNR